MWRGVALQLDCELTTADAGRYREGGEELLLIEGGVKEFLLDVSSWVLNLRNGGGAL
jgi:hypothetical protein